MDAGLALSADPVRLAAICRGFQVRQLSVFGSVARGEARPDSDADLVTKPALRPIMRDAILDEAQLLYAA